MTGWVLWLWLQASGAGGQLVRDLAPDPFAMLWLAPDPYEMLKLAPDPYSGSDPELGAVRLASMAYQAPNWEEQARDVNMRHIELAPSQYDVVQNAVVQDAPERDDVAPYELAPSPYDVSPVTD